MTSSTTLSTLARIDREPQLARSQTAIRQSPNAQDAFRPIPSTYTFTCTHICTCTLYASARTWPYKHMQLYILYKCTCSIVQPIYILYKCVYRNYRCMYRLNKCYCWWDMLKCTYSDNTDNSYHTPACLSSITHGRWYQGIKHTVVNALRNWQLKVSCLKYDNIAWYELHACLDGG